VYTVKILKFSVKFGIYRYCKVQISPKKNDRRSFQIGKYLVFEYSFEKALAIVKLKMNYFV